MATPPLLPPPLVPSPLPTRHPRPPPRPTETTESSPHLRLCGSGDRMPLDDGPPTTPPPTPSLRPAIRHIRRHRGRPTMRVWFGCGGTRRKGGTRGGSRHMSPFPRSGTVGDGCVVGRVEGRRRGSCASSAGGTWRRGRLCGGWGALGRLGAGRSVPSVLPLGALARGRGGRGELERIEGEEGRGRRGRADWVRGT